MDLNIREKLALVTGASSGLGRAVALALAGEGARLAVAARRVELLEEVAQQARAAGAADAQAFGVDLSDRDAVDRILAGVRERMGDVEILIANGGGPKAGTYLDVAPADWEAAHRSTLRAMLQLVDAVLPGMRSRRWGRIVALSSTSVEQPISNLVLSNTYRTALVAALKTLSGEVAREGITINSIATGRIATDRLFALYHSEKEMNEAAERDVPAGRVATPEEFAPLVVFLCSEGARYVTGQTIAIDGGLVRGLFG